MITLTENSARVSAASGTRTMVIAERFYALAHWLRSEVSSSPDAYLTVGVTSSCAGAGTSSVAFNLSAAAAQTSDRPVLLLDLSRCDSICSLRPGEADSPNVVEAVSQLREWIKPSSIENLSRVSPADLGIWLDRAIISELLRSLESEFGLIVADLPTTESNLCFATAGLLHGVLLVVETERTRSEAAAQAKQRLLEAHATVLGAILNKHPQHIPDWLAARL